MTDVFALLVFVIIVITCLLTVTITPILLLDRASCYSQLELNKLEGTWGPLILCQVKTTSGFYVPYNRYRVMEQMELQRK